MMNLLILILINDLLSLFCDRYGCAKPNSPGILVIILVYGNMGLLVVFYPFQAFTPVSQILRTG